MILMCNLVLFLMLYRPITVNHAFYMTTQIILDTRDSSPLINLPLVMLIVGGNR